MGCAWFYNLLKIRYSVQLLEILAVFLYSLNLLTSFWKSCASACTDCLGQPTHITHYRRNLSLSGAIKQCSQERQPNKWMLIMFSQSQAILPAIAYLIVLAAETQKEVYWVVFCWFGWLVFGFLLLVFSFFFLDNSPFL